MEVNELLELRDALTKSLRLIDDQLVELDWRHLANRSERVLAVIAYRKQNGTGLKESKDAVDAFIALIGVPPYKT